MGAGLTMHGLWWPPVGSSQTLQWKLHCFSDVGRALSKVCVYSLLLHVLMPAAMHSWFVFMLIVDIFSIIYYMF